MALAALPAIAGAQDYGAPYAGSQVSIAPDGPPVAAGVRLDPVFQRDEYAVRNEAIWNLPPAPAGTRWIRHYDDAVLVGEDGVVREVRRAIGWDDRGVASAAPVYNPVAVAGVPDPLILVDDEPLYAGSSRDLPGYSYDPRCFDRDGRRADGATVAGAVGGAVLGGVAGNVIAGRGDRTAGTLIGAGLGAVAGGVAGRELGRDRSPIGECPARTDGYSARRGVSYLPGGTTTTTVSEGGSTTTRTVTTTYSNGDVEVDEE